MFLNRSHLFFIILLISVFQQTFSRCLGEGLTLKLLVETRHAYLVKVKSVYAEGSQKVIKADVIKTFRGKTVNELTIYTHNNDVSWQEDAEAGLYKDGIFLVMPHADAKGKFRMGGCSYYVNSEDQEFKHDSICLSSFSSPNGFVNNGYYRGQLKNGKPVGFWIDHGDSGVYKNGKRSGEWKVYGEKYIYKKGKIVYWEEEMQGDSTVLHTKRVTVMLHKGQVISIWKRSRFSGEKITKFEGGKIKEEVFFDKREDISEIKCYKDGTLNSDSKYKPGNEKFQYPLEYSFDPEQYFYYKNGTCVDLRK